MRIFSTESPSTELLRLSTQTFSDRHLKIANLCLTCDKPNRHPATSLDSIILFWVLLGHRVESTLALVIVFHLVVAIIFPF